MTAHCRSPTSTQKPSSAAVSKTRATPNYARVRGAGAEILNEPHDAMNGAQRGYSARDLEGNLWTFGTARPNT
jgi:uncharacterized glyoxalase superfamily protein PhnB